MDKTENTLPCPNPWCEAGERDGDYGPAVRLHHFGTYRVVCTSCILEGPLRATEAEAVTAWNTRAALASHPPSDGQTEAYKRGFADGQAGMDAALALERFVFDWFNERDPDAVAEALAAFKDHSHGS